MDGDCTETAWRSFAFLFFDRFFDRALFAASSWIFQLEMLRDLTRENCASLEAGVTEFRQQPVGPAPLVEETDQSETDPREAATPRNLASVNPRRGSSTIRAAVMPARSVRSPRLGMDALSTTTSYHSSAGKSCPRRAPRVRLRQPARGLWVQRKTERTGASGIASVGPAVTPSHERALEEAPGDGKSVV